MKVQFKATEQMRSYHDLPHSWVDGDDREVSEDMGKYLITTFPDQFKVVKSTSAPVFNKKKK